MGDLMKRQSSILDLSGKKFLEWKVDAVMNLKAQGLEHTIKDNKSPSIQTTDTTTFAMTVVKPVTEHEKAKALVLLSHLHEGIKIEYKMDFKFVIDYNSTIHEIVSILRYCDHPVTDEQMIEKTLTTFHASNILLQEQYHERGFKRFNELTNVLLVAKQNSDLLLKNHNLRPTGSLATHHEANATSSYPPEKGQSSGSHKQTPSKGKDTCYRCGMTGHWGRTCRTAKHLVDLYQASVKGREKNAEANYVNEENVPCSTLDVSDFFMDNAEIGNDFIFGENYNT
ncbi:uncharacterized protein LOC110731484 [Chenopodium quinoa]|uniref:uncharacterized protein LOC110731484 n=1 Tax=Chenopodium quinoa TaxID=63459 RepID=UPI000B771F69|nr:uncharacterized protein LOC110731484 [Chenopodium quinoa]